jgi:hypothetical protein
MPAFIPANGAVEAAITVAVLIITFIGWLIQIAGQAKGQQPGPANRPRPPMPRPGAPPANRPRPRDERLQTEIDAFLRDVAGGRKPAAKEDKEDEDVAIEIIEDDAPAATRRIVPDVPAATPAGQLSEWDREQQRKRERLLSTLAERHLISTPLGADVTKHVEQYMKESLQLRQEKEQVEKRLAEANAELRALRAQSATTTGATARPGAQAAVRVKDLLRNRRTVKDAIVINEVLGRPKALSRQG